MPINRSSIIYDDDYRNDKFMYIFDNETKRFVCKVERTFDLNTGNFLDPGKDGTLVPMEFEEKAGYIITFDIEKQIWEQKKDYTGKTIYLKATGEQVTNPVEEDEHLYTESSYSQGDVFVEKYNKFMPPVTRMKEILKGYIVGRFEESNEPLEYKSGKKTYTLDTRQESLKAVLDIISSLKLMPEGTLVDFRLYDNTVTKFSLKDFEAILPKMKEMIDARRQLMWDDKNKVDACTDEQIIDAYEMMGEDERFRYNPELTPLEKTRSRAEAVTELISKNL